MTASGQRKYWAFAAVHILAVIAVVVGASVAPARGMLFTIVALYLGLTAKSVTAWAGRRWLREKREPTALPEVAGSMALAKESLRFAERCRNGVSA